MCDARNIRAVGIYGPCVTRGGNIFLSHRFESLPGGVRAIEQDTLLVHLHDERVSRVLFVEHDKAKPKRLGAETLDDGEALL
jgi:hypothetical protein